MPSDDDHFSHEDRALWAAVAADVVPLEQRQRPDLPPPPPPRARMRAQDERQVLEDLLRAPIEPDSLETGDESAYRRSGVRPAVLRKLRRGQFSVQDSIDLHGLTRMAAQQELTAFLRRALDRDLRCVKIIHGKGLRSPGGRPVLKARVELSLRQHGEVLAYASAPPWAGGHGAMLVLLRRRA